MLPRALMVDVDGVVVVRPRGDRWDAKLAVDLGVDPDDLRRTFFDVHWPDVVLGRADLHDRLARALAELGVDVDVESLIAYWFEQDSTLDHELLDDLARLRRAGVELHLVTVQEHRRAAYLWDVLGLRERFDGLHHSAAVGASKPDYEYFLKVEERIGLRGADLLLIDDSPQNVAAAREVGWRSRLWTRGTTLAEALAEVDPGA
jgi:putative hydrolase of the HAD superfamily